MVRSSIRNPNPGGGETFHAQFAVLVKFMNALSFVKIKLVNEIVLGLPERASVRLPANPGREYAAYLHHSKKPAWTNSKKLNTGSFQDSFGLDAPAGKYRTEWSDSTSGRSLAGAVRIGRHARDREPS